VAEHEVTVPDAVIELVGSAVLDVAVFDGIVPNTPPDRYVVVYADNGTLAALAACGESDSAMYRWQVTAVAPDRQMSAWLADKVRATVNTRPAVDGWECGPVEHTYSMFPQRDETVQERPVVYAVDQYSLLATRTGDESSSS
jgi:hypothetical protein